MSQALEILSPIFDNPENDIIDMARFVRITAKTKQTKITIASADGSILIGEMHLNAKESVVIHKASSMSVTCPDSYCTKVKPVNVNS